MRLPAEFDEAYYRRYYEAPATRVETPAEATARGDFVCSYLTYLGQPVRRVLDIGCGLGQWRESLHRHFPEARYTGVEISRYLCQRCGWRRGSVVDFRARRGFDLVVCADVLQYLDDADAERAIDNLAHLADGALYFAALTRGDWEQNCDRARTDARGYLRTAGWYRKRLRPHFVNAGGGLFVHKKAPLVTFELERCV